MSNVAFFSTAQPPSCEKTLCLLTCTNQLVFLACMPLKNGILLVVQIFLTRMLDLHLVSWAMASPGAFDEDEKDDTDDKDDDNDKDDADYKDDANDKDDAVDDNSDPSPDVP